MSRNKFEILKTLDVSRLFGKKIKSDCNPKTAVLYDIENFRSALDKTMLA